MTVKNLARLVYLTFGLVYLAAGVGVLSFRSGLLPAAAVAVIDDISHSSPYALHIMQEFGSHLLACGVFALWFAWRYEHSWVFQWAMTVAWTAFALIHWLDVREAGGDVRGPLVTTIPAALFVGVGLLRWRAERHGGAH